MREWEKRLRSANLRVTRPRLAVLAELHEHPHSGVDEIAAGARRRIGSLSTQAVYDVLHALTEARLLRRVEPAGSRPRFELQTDDNHHHLVCRSCGALADVECDGPGAPCLHPRADAGFVIDEAEVTFWGMCPDCQRSTQPN
ncbi:Fur family transcriptional regulator [Mycobacterium sp. SMC-4]|uniref:Fur family transcriptional regulator n=1 Tax=Mycobacterium sp. SMC-4 TaxID=2857059 RepID=UPI003D08C38F